MWHGEAPSGIGLATLRLDGLVALEAGNTEGVLITKPFTVSGNRLAINVDASGGGEFFVEALDDADKPIRGFSAGEAKTYTSVDELRLKPQWKTHRDLSSLNGKMIKLKFHLRNAKLYSFQIE